MQGRGRGDRNDKGVSIMDIEIVIEKHANEKKEEIDSMDYDLLGK